MIQVQSHNNSGLFRTKRYSKSRQKRRYGRLFIRRSKIYRSITNNSLSIDKTTNNSFSQSYPYYNNFTINYRPQTARLRHRRIRRNILNGAGDEKFIPSPSIEQKHIDFTELEHLFDNAIRNRLPLELYKEKPPTKNIILTRNESLHTESIPKFKSIINNNPTDTRIELSNQSTLHSADEVNCCFMYHVKQHRIVLAITLVTLAAVIGFLIVFIFVK